LTLLYNDEKTAQDLENAGLDMDSDEWSFKFKLRSGPVAILPISGPDRKQLWEQAQARHNGVFLVFSSGNYKYAINRDHLVFCQFQVHTPEEFSER